MGRGVNNKELADSIAEKMNPVHMKHYGQEQKSIIRQSSLKAAVHMVNGLTPHLLQQYVGTPLDMAALVKRIAEEFEEWVLR